MASRISGYPRSNMLLAVLNFINRGQKLSYAWKTAQNRSCEKCLNKVHPSPFQRVGTSVSDPFSSNPDTDPTKNINPDPDPVPHPDPSYFLPLSEIFLFLHNYKIFSSKEVN